VNTYILLRTSHLPSDLPLAPACNQCQTKITTYLNKSDTKPPLDRFATKNDSDDGSLSIQEIVPASDDDNSAGLIVEEEVPNMRLRRSIDVISQFLSADGFEHVNVLYNLHSGIRLGTVTAEVTHSGMALTITHAFCPSFHNVHAFKEAIKGLFAKDRDQEFRFRHLVEVSQLMKGDSNLVRGEKTINLPFACQQILCYQQAVDTIDGELMLFLELRSVHQTCRDNRVAYDKTVIKARKIAKRKNDSFDGY